MAAKVGEDGSGGEGEEPDVAGRRSRGKNDAIVEQDHGLSKRERRLAKRRGVDPTALQAEKDRQLAPRAAKRTRRDVDEGGAAVEVDASASSSPFVKTACTIWIGNLSFKTTLPALRRFFLQKGQDMITRINMPKGKAEGQLNRGFAFITFKDEEAQLEAIELTESSLDGRAVLIKSALDFQGRPEKLAPVNGGQGGERVSGSIASADLATTTTRTNFGKRILRRQSQPAGPTLYLGNLKRETTSTTVRACFEKTEARRESELPGVNRRPGKVASALKAIRMARPGPDGENWKGYAFLDFESIERATEALCDARNHKVDGHPVKLEYAGSNAVKGG